MTTILGLTGLFAVLLLSIWLGRADFIHIFILNPKIKSELYFTFFDVLN